MKYIFTIFVFLLLLISNSSAKKAEDIYFENIPAELLTNLKYEDVCKLKFAKTLENYNLIVNSIKAAEEDSSDLLFLCYLLDSNASFEMIPAIIKIVDDNKSNASDSIHCFRWFVPDTVNTVSNNIIHLLENFYNFCFIYNEGSNTVTKEPSNSFKWKHHDSLVAPYWKKLWKNDSINYRNWGKSFYDETLLKMQEADSLDFSELNYIIDSRYRQDQDSSIWKNFLSKIKASRFFYLSADSIFKVDSLAQLEQLMNCKDMFSDIFRYLSDYNQVHFEKIYPALQQYSEVDQGEIISELLNYEVIRTAIIQNPNRKIFTNQYIQNMVKKYRNHYSQIVNSDKSFAQGKTELDRRSGSYVRGYNVYNDPLYFLDMQDMNYEQQLEFIVSKLRKREQRKCLSKLIDTTKFKNLVAICKYAKEIDTVDNIKFIMDGLSVKLGIPLIRYSIDNISSLENICSNKTDEEIIHYFAVDLYPELFYNQKLNYKLISKEMESALVQNNEKYKLDTNQYAWSNSILRFMEYSSILTLIRILELEHHTRLGFKYQFDRYNPKSTQKRINAWIEYLRDKGLIDKEIK